MSDATKSARLLQKVEGRLRWQALAGRFSQLLVLGCLVYLTALLVSRMTGWGLSLFSGTSSEGWPWMLLALIPVTAAVVPWLTVRRRPLQETARVIDRAAGSSDLYLTLSLLRTSAGEYQPLVIAAAERQSEAIRPEQVVPLSWQRRHWHAVWLPAAVAVAFVVLPQFDPFGKVASASLSSQRKERLEESRQQTRLRVAEVQKADTENDDSQETDAAIKDLQLAFNKMQPQQKQLNFESLMDQQKQLAEQWKKQSTDPLQNLLKATSQSSQQFGSDDQEMMQKWTKDLQAGSTESLQQEMESLKDELQKLAKTQDPVQQEEQRKELKKKLERLDQFARKSLENKPLSAALQRAMNQLDLSSLDELSSEALEGAMESLELSEMELDQLAQTAKDLKKLEDALKNLQLAKKLNDRDQLDGKDCQSCKSMSDYEKLYKKLLAQSQGPCQGEGKCAGCGQCQGSQAGAGKNNGSRGKGAGTGQGNATAEDSTVSPDFQTELAQSAVTAGQVLMSVKSKGPGEKSKAVVDYQGLIQQVRQGASEAILQEQVPPGYHDNIKKYFDRLQPVEKQ